MKRLRQIFKHPILFRTIQILLLAGTLLVVFPPDFPLFKAASNYAMYVMLLLLGGGFFFLFMDHKSLMFTSLFCSAALCLFLKDVSNKHLVLPKQMDAPALKVGLFNVTRFTDQLNRDIELIKGQDADVLVFQEVTPEWESFLIDHLKDCFDFKQKATRIDPFGQIFFSKLPFAEFDTIWSNHPTLPQSIPTYAWQVVLESEQPIQMISLHTLPFLNQADYQWLEDQLIMAGEHIDQEEASLFIGDINVPGWNSELQRFKYQYQLMDSRRTSKLFKMPYDHLLYNPFLECIGFEEIKSGNEFIGIVGKFQRIQPNEPS